jgi:Amt family ammonium transporter
VGAICGFVMVFSVEFIDRILKIDDPVGASSVHGTCGFLGTILTGLLATDGGLFYGGGWNLFLVQLTGAVVISVWALVGGFIIFKSLDKFAGGLRVNRRVEEEGLDIYEHGETAYN